MMNTIFGFGTFRWVRLALLATAASTCACGSAIAQSSADAPLPSPAAPPQAAGGALDLAPGEMLMNPETIPPELRPKFPENAPPESVMAGTEHLQRGPAAHLGGPEGTSVFCGGCDPGYLGRFDALYMTNDSAEGVGLINQFRLDEFDYEWGGRATLRRQFDCVNGYEVVATVMPEWEEIQRETRALDSIFDFADGDGDAEHAQGYRAEYYSFEANRTYNGWDVANTLVGLRVIDYEEEFAYGVETDGDEGVYRQKTENFLVGLQAGIDLHYPLSQRLWSSVRARGGLFANFADGRTFFDDTSDGDAPLNNKPDDEDYAGLIELGTSLRYDLGPALSIHGGYEVWYLHNVATASDQLIAPGLNNRLVIDDDVFMHGLSAGARLRY